MVKAVSDTPRKPLWKRWWIYIPLALILLVCIVFFLDAPRRYIVSSIASSYLHADVSVKGIGLTPGLTARTITIRDDKQAEPVAVIDGARVNYSLRPEDGRLLRQVTVDNVELNVIQRSSTESNFQFVDTILAQPPSGNDPTPYIPKEVAVENIKAHFTSPYAELNVEGIALKGTADALNDMVWTLTGSNVTGTSQLEGIDVDNISGGDVLVQVTVREDAFELNPVHIQVPGFTEFEGYAELNTSEDVTAFSLAVPQGQLDGSFVSAVAPAFISIPLRVTSLDLTDTQMEGSFGAGGYGDWEGRIHAVATGLTVGDPDARWFEGDLGVEGSLQPGGKFDLVATLNETKQVKAVGSYIEKTLSASIDTGTWAKAEWAALVPENMLAAIEAYTTIDTVAAAMDVYTDGTDYRVEGTASPVFVEGDATVPTTIHINGGGPIADAGGPRYKGVVSVDVADGSIALELDASGDLGINAKAALTKVDPKSLATLAAGGWRAKAPSGALDGTIEIGSRDGFSTVAALQFQRAGSQYQIGLTADATMSSFEDGDLTAKGAITTGESGKATYDLGRTGSNGAIKGDLALQQLDVAHLAAALDYAVEGLAAAVISGDASVSTADGVTSVNLDLQPDALQYGEWSVPDVDPFNLKGGLQWKSGESAIAIASLEAVVADAVTISMNNGRVDMANAAFNGDLKGKIDFDALGSIMEPTGLSGSLAFDLPVKRNGDVLQSHVRLEGDGFGYGRWAGSYGRPLVLEADVRHNTKTKSGSAPGATVTYADDTKIVLSSLDYTTDPLHVEGPFDLITPLSILEDLRILNQADGAAEWSGKITWGDNGLALDAEGDANAEVVVLPNNYAAIGGLAMEGAIAWRDSLSGEGRFRVANAAAAGAVIHDIVGTFVIEAGVLKATITGGSLYNGALTGDMEVDLIGETRAGRVRMDVEGLDLGQFTEEYEPPQVTLTGLANGKVNVEWDRTGMTGLHAVLKSEEGFSLDRATIETLLVTNVMQETRGLRFLTKGLRKDAIGSETQHPFESALLIVDLLGESRETQRLEGPVQLKSPNLDLTIDLGVDLLAIYAGLELRQEAQLDQIDTISSEPLQWDE